MAEIKINEVSQNYSYSIGSNSFCSVALPITSSWGPAFEDPEALGITLDAELDKTAFTHFYATQSGLESFISTYRGPATNYRSASDYSYQLAMTLLTAGYDLDVCRVCPGAHASVTFAAAENSGSVTFTGKYPGSFGNSLYVTLSKVKNKDYWNLITYVVDSTGTKTAVENILFAFNIEDSTDSVLYVKEVSSSFVNITVSGISTDGVTFETSSGSLTGGSDRAAEDTAEKMIDSAIALATERYDSVEESDSTKYLASLEAIKTAGVDVTTASTIKFREWVFNATMHVLDILTDKLAYNCSRIALPGWDDQDIEYLTGETVDRLDGISPLHSKIMDVAYQSRCATAFVDIPRCLNRSGVYNETGSTGTEGYAQKLSSYTGVNANDALYASHSALFAPWGQYTYVGTSKQNIAPPSFLALMIQRAMISNQSLQYEWALPTTRKHSLTIGKLDYVVPKKLLDEWQSIEGTALNIIADIPDLGVSVWGNSTLYPVPLATYNALQNLSTRFLVNAIENVAYKCGISITFQYNNDEAYSRFYAGVTPILDNMKSVGAIEGYKVKMSADIDSLNSVNANSVIGQIYITVNGVVNNITIDLVALPQSADLSTY